MQSLFVSFDEQNVRMGDHRWLIKGPRLMRFEWLALLALKRRLNTGNQGWATIDEISRLPAWSGKSHHDVSTNVGRYLEAFERRRLAIVRGKARWAGPYQLNVNRDAISFDVPLREAERRLAFAGSVMLPSRDKLLRFTLQYARAQSFFFQGRLSTTGPRLNFQQGAFARLVTLVDDRSYGPKLRAIAWLAGVQVLFQIGYFERARKALDEYQHLLARARDSALTARYFLALAWSHQRASSGTSSDRETLSAIRNASLHLERTTDREVEAALAYRTSGYLTKHGRHADAVAELVRALQAILVIGNFYNVQAYCIDIGSDLHRLGPEYYREAHDWILVGLRICNWMRIGNENAHGETILGKMFVEQGRKRISRLWLERALRVAQQANNTVSLADAHMVMGLWHQRFGAEGNTVESLVQALTIFRSLPRFDCVQKERYMARKFPEVWPIVLSRVAKAELLRKSVSRRTN